MEIEEKLKRIKDKSGKTLYSHLSNVIGKMMLDQCQDPCEEFERYSEELKVLENFEGFVDVDLNLIREDGLELKPQIERLRTFLNLKMPEEGQKTEETVQLGEIKDLMYEQIIARTCGVSLGQEEAYLLYNSIKKFMGEKNFTKIEFWGKILGRQKNYWVIESFSEATEETNDLTDPHEPMKQGVNAKVFWVSTDLLEGNWKVLPLVSQKQVNQSRKLKYLFLGDLERKIISSPPFDGLEKHYVDLIA